MGAPRATALTLVVLTLALGTAGCGGTAAKTSAASARTRAAEARWRAGLGRWRHTMVQALDGISVVFSTERSLIALEDVHSPIAVRLGQYESTLAGCSGALRRVGPVPQAFRISGRYAGQACESLERGERLVVEAVLQLGRNTLTDPLDPLSRANGPLSAGQSELTTAIVALRTPSSP